MKIVRNKFCRGTCSSYFVPKLRPRKLKLRSHFRSCSACTPTDYDIIDVKLDCPFLNKKYIVQKVYKVKKCSCINVDVPNAIELSNISLFNA
uniref:DAN domain-containing protein n=1 Tax=Syphacia muris TaxID=451379 RepID=A0A0N5AYT0_9BILA